MRRFAAFILTHGRADNVKTDKMLRKQGYTGPIYYIVDDEDEQLARYTSNFGKDVIVFSKREVAKYTDAMDNFGHMGTITYARNACWDIAKKLGLTHFIQLDDDYTEIVSRMLRDNRLVSYNMHIMDLDRAFEAMCEFIDNTPVRTVAFAQGGDMMGGANSSIYKGRAIRKAMNSFVCRTDRPIRFRGTMNEDVNTYTSLGALGSLFITMREALVKQKETQSQPGGITELYKQAGTYQKALYTVMAAPSCVKVKALQALHPRIHHAVTWRYAVPKILREEHKHNDRQAP